MDKTTNRILAPSPIVKEIASQWMDYCQRKNLDTRGPWYLYNMACGWIITKEQAQILAAWIKTLDHEKKDVKTVYNFINNI